MNDLNSADYWFLKLLNYSGEQVMDHFNECVLIIRDPVYRLQCISAFAAGNQMYGRKCGA